MFQVPYVTKLEIAVANVAQGGGGYVGVLGNPDIGPAGTLPRTGVHDYTTQKAFYPLQLGTRGKGAVQAIAISADSAIASCDIYLGGLPTVARRFRIAPGKPLIADLSEFEQALISPNWIGGTIANIATIGPNLPATIAAWQRQNFAWESAEQPFSVSSGFSSWPLRLDIHRGGVGIVDRMRAPYRANLRVDTLTTNGVSIANDVACLYVCVDGRKRVDVSFWLDGNGGGAQPNYQIDEIRFANVDANPSQPLAEAYNMVAATALANTTWTIKSFAGNPMGIVRAFLSGTATGYQGTIQVDAYDDY